MSFQLLFLVWTVLFVLLESTVTAFYLHDGILKRSHHHHHHRHDNIFINNRCDPSSSLLFGMMNGINMNHLLSFQKNNYNTRCSHHRILSSTTSMRTTTTTTTSIAMTATNRRMGELTSQENTAYQVLRDISKSLHTFRVVVVGKNTGTILESTIQPLGSVIKITQSPSKGKQNKKV
jgi:energy-coupling factor transporter transmembrane protein EcfT